MKNGGCGRSCLDGRLPEVAIPTLTAIDSTDHRRDAEVLLALAAPCAPFQSPEGRLFVDMRSTAIPGARALAIGSARFREWFTAAFTDVTGRLPSRATLSMVLQVLKAHAARSPVCDVDLRATTFNRFDPRRRSNEIFIDLGRADAETIRITPEGWQIAEPGIAPMRNAPGSLALPTPDPCGSLEPLRPLLNLSCDQDWIRVQAWLVSALNPGGPYPVLILEGPARSGKSTAAAFLRSLIDAVAAPLSVLPSRDVAVFKHAMENRVVAFDDVARISPAVSGALCHLSTGIGYDFKEPYARDEPVCVQLTRPVILTGNKLKLDPSLRNRALVIQMSALADRVSPSEMEKRFEAVRPVVLGGLCDAVSAALRRHDTLELTDLPMQADAAIWSAAALERVDSEEVLDAFLPWADAGSNPFTEAIIAFTEERTTWSGSATELLKQLRALEVPNLPATPKGLSQLLARLDSAAIEITFPRLPGGLRRIHLNRAHAISNQNSQHASQVGQDGIPDGILRGGCQPPPAAPIDPTSSPAALPSPSSLPHRAEPAPPPHPPASGHATHT